MNRRNREQRKARTSKIRQRVIEQQKDALKTEKPKIASKSDLDNNSSFDFELVFTKKSKRYFKRQSEMQAFVTALSQKPCPDKLRPPIATGKKRELQSWRNVETFLANVYAMKDKGKTSIAVSLSPNTYAHRKVNSGIINLYKLADAFGYVELRGGYFNANYRRQSFMARIVPLKKLFDLLDKTVDVKADIEQQADSEIEVRRTVKSKTTYQKHGRTFTTELKTKELIPQKKWSKSLSTKQYEDILMRKSAIRWFNLVFSDYNMKYQDEKGRWRKLDIKLKAIFTDDFEQGGRFYTRGQGHQTKSKAERNTIRFNNRPTKELDYGGLHIRMLYHLAGTDFPLNNPLYLKKLRKAMKRVYNVIMQKKTGRTDCLKIPVK